MDNATLIALGGLAVAAVAIFVSLRIRADKKRKDKLDKKKDDEIARLQDRLDEMKRENSSLRIFLESSDLLPYPQIPEQPPKEIDRYQELAAQVIEKGGSIDLDELIRIGNAEYSKSSYDKAEHYYRVALHQAQQRRARKQVGLSKGNIGLIYKNQGNLDEALKYLKDGLAILDQHGLTYGRDVITRAINEIGQDAK